MRPRRRLHEVEFRPQWRQSSSYGTDWNQVDQTLNFNLYFFTFCPSYPNTHSRPRPTPKVIQRVGKDAENDWIIAQKVRHSTTSDADESGGGQAGNCGGRHAERKLSMLLLKKAWAFEAHHFTTIFNGGHPRAIININSINHWGHYNGGRRLAHITHHSREVPCRISSQTSNSRQRTSTVTTDGAGCVFCESCLVWLENLHGESRGLLPFASSGSEILDD
ncbi:hypothetical protein GWK47_024440 [Chionoecetes opilio]|uniref:Uncharacterized protein n=1 Tax=Chionoecetes opilio TaxID=41210 RepID=A0A8J4XLT0_CHIOP|nr:hypothetical protein GWK47_024440 [Chionoecetes opilio]